MPEGAPLSSPHSIIMCDVEEGKVQNGMKMGYVGVGVGPRIIEPVGGQIGFGA